MSETAVHHIIHDVDRDGWWIGRATCRAPETGRVPTSSKAKNVLDLIRDCRAEPGDAVWVLDIPGPSHWARVLPDDVPLTWVDHHMAAWDQPVPPWVRAVLPAGARPTTTMSLLLTRGLVDMPRPRPASGSLFSRAQQGDSCTPHDRMAARRKRLRRHAGSVAGGGAGLWQRSY